MFPTGGTREIADGLEDMSRGRYVQMEGRINVYDEKSLLNAWLLRAVASCGAGLGLLLCFTSPLAARELLLSHCLGRQF